MAAGVTGDVNPTLWTDTGYWDYVQGILSTLEDWEHVEFVSMKMYHTVNTIMFLTELPNDPKGISIAPIPGNWVLA